MPEAAAQESSFPATVNETPTEDIIILIQHARASELLKSISCKDKVTDKKMGKQT